MKKLIVWAILLAGGGYLGAKFYLHYRVSSDLDQMLLMISPFAQVDYDGVSSTISGKLSIDDVRVQVNGFRDPIRADKLTLITPGFWYLINLDEAGSNMVASDIPESMGIAISGLETSTDSDLIKMLYDLGQQDVAADREIDAAAECTGKYGYTPDVLRRLGYEKLNLDLHVGYRKDGNNMIVDVRTAVKDMYDVNIELTLDGAMSPKAMTMGTYRPRMLDGRLEYVDRSL